jgi:hypothetical protein
MRRGRKAQGRPDPIPRSLTLDRRGNFALSSHRCWRLGVLFLCVFFNNDFFGILWLLEDLCARSRLDKTLEGRWQGKNAASRFDAQRNGRLLGVVWCFGWDWNWVGFGLVGLCLSFCFALPSQHTVCLGLQEMIMIDRWYGMEVSMFDLLA